MSWMMTSHLLTLNWSRWHFLYYISNFKTPRRHMGSTGSHSSAHSLYRWFKHAKSSVVISQAARSTSCVSSQGNIEELWMFTPRACCLSIVLLLMRVLASNLHEKHVKIDRLYDEFTLRSVRADEILPATMQPRSYWMFPWNNVYELYSGGMLAKSQRNLIDFTPSTSENRAQRWTPTAERPEYSNEHWWTMIKR